MYHIVKFADPIKSMVRGLLTAMSFGAPTVQRMLEGDLKEEVIPGFATVTPRKLFQTLGTEWGREAIEENLWVKLAVNRIQNLRAMGYNVVVDDMRFPNEYAAMVDIGAKTLLVTRPGVVRTDDKYEGLLDGCMFDIEVDNTGTRSELRDWAVNLAESIEPW
jgi:hypothetical protein